jgi:hypothetical protein
MLRVGEEAREEVEEDHQLEEEVRLPPERVPKGPLEGLELRLPLAL